MYTDKPRRENRAGGLLGGLRAARGEGTWTAKRENCFERPGGHHQDRPHPRHLEQHDPQALKQAKTAYYAFFPEENLREAKITSIEPMGGSSRLPGPGRKYPGGAWTGDEGEEIL
jgi:hypothetical protein